MPMTMRRYVDDIAYAAERIIGIIWHEANALEKLEETLAESTRETNEAYKALLEADARLGEGRHQGWTKFVSEEKVRTSDSIATQAQEERLRIVQFSVQAAAGALLQFAKQGISLVYSNPGNAKGGGMISTLARAEVIWQGRNQALHWEEGKFTRPLVACFNELSKIDPAFSSYSTRSLAFEVVKLLGWRTKADFDAEMLSL